MIVDVDDEWVIWWYNEFIVQQNGGGTGSRNRRVGANDGFGVPVRDHAGRTNTGRYYGETKTRMLMRSAGTKITEETRTRQPVRLFYSGKKCTRIWRTTDERRTRDHSVVRCDQDGTRTHFKAEKDEEVTTVTWHSSCS